MLVCKQTLIAVVIIIIIIIIFLIYIIILTLTIMIRLGSKLRLPSGFPLLAERADLQTLPGAAIDHFITVIMLLALAPTGAPKTSTNKIIIIISLLAERADL